MCLEMYLKEGAALIAEEAKGNVRVDGVSQIHPATVR